MCLCLCMGHTLRHPQLHIYIHIVYSRVYPTEIHWFPHELTKFRSICLIALPPAPCRCAYHHTILRASHTCMHEHTHLTYTCCSIQACTPPMVAPASTTVHLPTPQCSQFTLHAAHMHATIDNIYTYTCASWSIIVLYMAVLVPNIDQSYTQYSSHRIGTIMLHIVVLYLIQNG